MTHKCFFNKTESRQFQLSIFVISRMSYSLQTLTPLCCVMSNLKAQEFFPNMQKVSTELWKTLEFCMEGHVKYKHCVERCAHIKQPKQNKYMQMQQHLSVMSSTSSGRNLPAFRGVYRLLRLSSCYMTVPPENGNYFN